MKMVHFKTQLIVSVFVLFAFHGRVFGEVNCK